jgi:hypothetical protein
MFKAARAFSVILLLTCSALAGDMQNGSPQPPPIRLTYSVAEAPTAESIGITATEPPADALTEAVFSILKNALALL